MWSSCLSFELFCSYGGIQFATEDWISQPPPWFIGYHCSRWMQSSFCMFCILFIVFSSVTPMLYKIIETIIVWVCVYVFMYVCVFTGMPHTVCLWSSQDNFMKSFFLLTMNSWDGSQSSIMYSKHLHQLTHFVDSTLDFKLVICVITNICSCKTHITALFSYSSNLYITFSEFHFCIYIQQYILYYLCCLCRNLIFTLLHILTIF